MVDKRLNDILEFADMLQEMQRNTDAMQIGTWIQEKMLERNNKLYSAGAYCENSRRNK